MTREERLRKQYQVIKNLTQFDVYILLKDFIMQSDDINIEDYCDIESGDFYGMEGFIEDKKASQKSLREASKQLQSFRKMAWNVAIFAQALVDGFSGRLEIEPDGAGRLRVSYTAGQYYATEYRDAVAEVIRKYKSDFLH